MILLMSIVGQTTLQLGGRVGFDFTMPMQWRFYQEGEDKLLASGPLMGATGVFRTGDLGLRLGLLSGSFDGLSVESDDSTTQVDSAEASRSEFSVEVRYFIHDFYIGFGYTHHSESWEVPAIWRINQEHNLNCFGLAMGFDLPGKKASITPWLNASVNYITGVRTTKVGSITDDVSGTGIGLSGAIGAVYHYKPVFLSAALTGQALSGRFGDDEKLSHSNYWGVLFSIGGEF